MIKSFQCKETEKVCQGQAARGLPREIQDRALSKLRQLDAALTMDDLRNPPSNRLELLKGDRKGRWSIRINAQWRVCFLWQSGEAFEVEIVDYH